MHKISNNIKVILVFSMAIWGACLSNAVGADGGLPIVTEYAMPVQVHGVIMAVDAKRNSVVVMEHPFTVTPFIKNGKRHIPQLTDAKGNAVAFKDLKEKQLVLVQSYRVDKSVFYVEKLQLVDNGGFEKEQRTIQHVKKANGTK
jgi:hypothetical protein